MIIYGNIEKTTQVVTNLFMHLNILTYLKVRKSKQNFELFHNNLNLQLSIKNTLIKNTLNIRTYYNVY